MRFNCVLGRGATGIAQQCTRAAAVMQFRAAVHGRRPREDVGGTRVEEALTEHFG